MIDVYPGRCPINSIISNNKNTGDFGTFKLVEIYSAFKTASMKLNFSENLKKFKPMEIYLYINFPRFKFSRPFKALNQKF